LQKQGGAKQCVRIEREGSERSFQGGHLGSQIEARGVALGVGRQETLFNEVRKKRGESIQQRRGG